MNTLAQIIYALENSNKPSLHSIGEEEQKTLQAMEKLIKLPNKTLSEILGDNDPPSDWLVPTKIQLEA